MRRSHRIAVITVPIVAVLLILVAVRPAGAATLDEKLAVMLRWSQPTSTSYNAWNAGYLKQGAWTGYSFDWSTDLCSQSPDRPLGFDFRMPCRRHDFGYRNYKAVNRFPANKARIDDSFYFDLKARCGTYSAVVRPACNSLAWTYYEAVHVFGSVSVSSTDIAVAAALKARAEAQAVVAARVAASPT